ncbi:MAG: serine hydrolase [Gemmatimonadetes bacterium]|nr:serine hydrolase [Gemmatimonadota bacterium]
MTHLRRTACLVATALLSATAGAQRPDWAAFDRWVTQGVADWQVPGLAVAVVKDDSVVFSRGYGVRQLGAPTTRVDVHTRFAIGSTTKAMTALALLMLQDEGKVRLDDPVIRYLPTLQLYDPVLTRELTVRDLLTHHTGLPGSDLLWSGGDYSTAEVIRRMRHLPPATSFRNSYHYQNVQYAMAGEVVRVASGMPWEQFVAERIHRPLGMGETVSLLSQLAGAPNVAAPHMVIDGAVTAIENRSVDPVAAAGSVWSSVHDMAKWMRFVLDSGRVGGRRLVSPSGFTDWLSAQVVVPQADFYPTRTLTRPHHVNYGLGWFLHDYRGMSVAMHTGSIDGQVAIIGLVPDQRLGVYVLANLDHAELRHAILHRVLDLYGGGAARDWSAELRQLYGRLEAEGKAAEARQLAAQVKGTRPSLDLSRYVGTYSDSLYGDATVALRDGRLRFAFGKGFTGWLSHFHYDTFLVPWDDRRAGQGMVSFVLDATGQPVAVEALGTRFARRAQAR